MILKDKLQSSPLTANNHAAKTPKAVLQQVKTLMRDVKEQPRLENVDEILNYVMENFPDLTHIEVEIVYRDLLGWIDELQETE